MQGKISQLHLTSTAKAWTLLTLAAILLFAHAFQLSAQRITASIRGTVRDSTTAVIPTATVTVMNTGTRATSRLQTNGSGQFDVSNLPPGPYNITVDAPGFKHLERSGLVLNVDQTAQIDLVMEVGSTTETIRVDSAEPLLETQTSDIGQVIGTRSIENLPLNQRNTFSLVLLATGVTGTVRSDFNGLQFNVNGARAGNTDVLLDGVPASPPTDNVTVLSIFPSVDATQEFKFQTNNYSTQFGNAAGGIINVIYKSGTNDLHGSVYDFLRNSYVDANNFFANRFGFKLPSFKRNQFGFSLGGPVYIPKLYNGRDKTFFFVDYEGLRQDTASQLTTTVPTLAERGGDFSALATSTGAKIVIYDPATTVKTVSANGSTSFSRSPFPGNFINPSRFDPVGANILKYYPLPNTPGTFGRNNYIVNASSPYIIDQYDIKVDEIISDRHRVSFRFSKRNPTTGYAHQFPSAIQVAQNATTGSQPAIGAGLDYTFAKSSTYIFELRAGVSHVNYNVATAGDGFDPATLGFPSYLGEAAVQSSATALTFPGIAPAGYLAIGSGGQQGKGNNGYLQDSLLINNTKMLNRHTLNFGGEFRILANNANGDGGATGSFTFGTTLTQGPNALTASPTAGDGFASLLLGLGTSGSVVHYFKIVNSISHYAAAYLQDDWRVTDKLTLNLGLRYDLFRPRTERHNQTTFLDLNVPSPLAATTGLPGLKGGLQYAGVNGNPRNVTDPNYKNFSPRVGFAYHPFRPFVLRAAYGIFFADSPNQAAATVQNTGYRATTSYFGTLDGATPNNYLSNPFPGGAFVAQTGNTFGLLTGTGGSIVAGLRRQPSPYSENYQLGVEYQLPSDWLVGVTYVGSRGLQLPFSPSYNQLPDSALALGGKLLETVSNPFQGKVQISGPLSGATVQRRYLLAPFPQFTTVNGYQDVGAISRYDSVQIRVERRFSKNATLLLSYTGSKSLDDYSISNSNYGNNGTYQDASIPLVQDSYSLSSFDISRNLVISGVYNLPFGRGQQFGSHWNRLVDTLFGGYGINGIFSAHNGTPLAFSANNVANIFNPGERPNSNGQNASIGGRVEDRLSKYFNTATFSQPATYTFGNMSRTSGYLRNPGLRNLDVSVSKEFFEAERVKAVLKVEAFNAFNTPAFSGPVTNVADPNFGVVSAQSNSPRQLQVGLKILF
ncbi:TonB-dependent receptor [Granulicella sp. dw_53]|uniref:TonB-dependent receptor n=1 Tax=Granulicella sp. dw_53 TaxID=2719792 RepID=UPI001BD2C6B0|nr:TonB-dependent receptor [Granulicella sp. dw_53]